MGKSKWSTLKYISYNKLTTYFIIHVLVNTLPISSIRFVQYWNYKILLANRCLFLGLRQYG